MSNPKRSKAWGYEVEVAALEALREVFVGLRRTGSVNYKHAAPDLVQDGTPPTICLVVTRDKRSELLVTLSVSDLRQLVGAACGERKVIVQVKGRERTWIGSLMKELRKSA